MFHESDPEGFHAFSLARNLTKPAAGNRGGRGLEQVVGCGAMTGLEFRVDLT